MGVNNIGPVNTRLLWARILLEPKGNVTAHRLVNYLRYDVQNAHLIHLLVSHQIHTK